MISMRLILILFLTIQCVSAHAQKEKSDGKELATEQQLKTGGDGNATSNTADHATIDAISDEDLNDCAVLLGQRMSNEFQYYLSTVKKLADGGDLDYGIHYAAIMNNRFVCNEDEILGKQLWAVTVRNKKASSGKSVGQG